MRSPVVPPLFQGANAAIQARSSTVVALRFVDLQTQMGKPARVEVNDDASVRSGGKDSLTAGYHAQTSLRRCVQILACCGKYDVLDRPRPGHFANSELVLPGSQLDRRS